MTQQRLLNAYLDESQSHHELDPNTYILAAAVCAPNAADIARPAMTALQLRGQIKVHWRDESERRRRQIAEVIAGLPLQHVVVVRDGLAGERNERRRRHCLERMLYELDQLKVADATFESRGRSDDQRDRDMLDSMRARRVLAGDLRMSHRRGPDEALLWVPDAVCGAIASRRVGIDTYAKIIEDRIDVQVITITAR